LAWMLNFVSTKAPDQATRLGFVFKKFLNVIRLAIRGSRVVPACPCSRSEAHPCVGVLHHYGVRP
jgi:hypothetical protein